jgi:adenylate kinase family enzyme
MKRVIVIGCPGSGKSTVSRALHNKTGIPLYHLDMMYWNADKTTVSRDIFDARLQEVLEKDA